MPMPGRRSSTKSLPPLPLPALASRPHPPARTATSTSTNQTPGTSSGGDAATPAGGARGRMTPACIRMTVTVVVFGAYMLWALPWHLRHGWEGIPWLDIGRWGPSGGEAGSETAPSMAPLRAW